LPLPSVDLVAVVFSEMDVVVDAVLDGACVGKA